MKSLFAKILLWFLATILIAFAGFTAIVLMNVRDPLRQPAVLRALGTQAHAARVAYESGGRDALRAELERVKDVFDADAFLTDSAGHDLLTGQDRSDLLAAGRRRPFLRRSRGLVVRRTDDGRYWFILSSTDDSARRWLVPTEQLWVLAAVVLLSYLLARYLTSPLRGLQSTLERFGQGDFSARVNSSRRDELGQLARTFDQMAGRIQNLMAAERRLLLDISHELRSPLARLGVAVELARSGENREAALDRIQKESDRLNALVGELLQVTRAEVDPNTLRAQPVRLDQLLADVVSDCSIEAAARGSSLALDAPTPVTVPGDPELLRRATENVIRNAIRFAPPQTTVEVRLRANGGKAMVEVRDYGPGVPEESLARIFDAFYRVEGDRNRGSGGVGLGLAIARRAVDLHKGSLRALNARPGLLVELELPVAPTSASSESSYSPAA